MGGCSEASSYSRLLQGYESVSSNEEAWRGNGAPPFVRRAHPQRAAHHNLLCLTVYDDDDDGNYVKKNSFATKLEKDEKCQEKIEKKAGKNLGKKAGKNSGNKVKKNHNKSPKQVNIFLHPLDQK